MKPASPLNEPLVVRPRARRSSVRVTPSGSSRIATCQFSSTNRPTWCDGRRGHGCFCAPRSSSGRKAIPCMKPKPKRAKKLSVCSVFTKRFVARSLRHPGFCRRKIGEREISRRRANDDNRSNGPGPKGDPGGHIAFSRQNFARASGIQFQNREGKQEFGWTTSWA